MAPKPKPGIRAMLWRWWWKHCSALQPRFPQMYNRHYLSRIKDKGWDLPPVSNPVAKTASPTEERVDMVQFFLQSTHHPYSPGSLILRIRAGYSVFADRLIVGNISLAFA
jgi:hypothetical protein